MRFKYEQKILRPGEEFDIRDGDMFTGTSVAADGQGGFTVIAHIVKRIDGDMGMGTTPPAKELPN